MITAGNMDERVTVLAPTVTRSDSGAQVVTYASIGTRFASVRYLKGNRALTSGEVYMHNTIAVSMRPMAGLSDICRLQWNGNTYRIESLNKDRSEGEVNITASVIDTDE